ncbi:hypothetical protein BSKO_00554 [Bryopsis sp. KO-2023]|nr:hypothetical protein BSKO_00554 [Bryopsis sp. KO-2023]
MYLCKSVVRGSSVVGVALGHFRSVGFQDLVLCRGTVLELKEVGQELVHVHEQNIFASVEDIKTLPTSCFSSTRGDTPCDTVILLSRSGNLSIVSFDADVHRFIVLSHVGTRVAGFPSIKEDLQFCVSPDAAAVCLARPQDQIANLWINQSNSTFLKDPVHHFKKLQKDGEARWGQICSICYLAPNKSTGYQHIAVLAQRSFTCSCKLEVLKCCRSGGIWSLFRLHFPCNSRWVQTLGSPDHLEPVPGHKGGLVIFGSTGFAVLDCSVIHTMGEEVDPVEMQMCTGYDHSLGKIVLLVLRPFPEQPSAVKSNSLELSKSLESSLLPLRPAKSSTSAMLGSSIPILDTNASDVLLSGTGSTFLASCGQECEILDVAWAKSASGDGLMPVNEYCVYIASGGAVHQMTIKVVSMGSQLVWEFGFEEFVYEHTGPVSCMAVLPGGELLIHSSEGDGCMLKPLESELIALPGRSFPKVFTQHQVIQNHGPVHDFVVMDDATSATGKTICAATGEGETGCLRKITTGHSISGNHAKCDSELDFQGVSRLWAVREFAADCLDQLLVVSFTMGTRALATGPVFEDVTDALGLRADTPTLACGRICDGFLVQVTPTCVALCNMDTLSLDNKKGGDGGSSCPRREGSRDYGLDRSMRTRLPEVNVRQWSQKGKRDRDKYRDSDVNDDDDDNDDEAASESQNRSVGNAWTTPRVAGDEKNSDRPSKITVAVVVEEMVCIYCDDAQELTVLGVDGTEDSDQGGPGRKRARTQAKLQVWGSIILDQELPSCLQIVNGISPSTWFCIMGSYKPGIKVFAIPGRNQSPVPHCSLSEESICSRMISLHSDLGFPPITDDERHPDPFIPESIMSCRGPIELEETSVRFLVGFRNGTLAEYTLEGSGGDALKCNSLVHIGARPLWMVKIDESSIMCMSDRTFLMKYMESSGCLVSFPLALPSNIVSGTILMGNETLWHTVKAGSLVPNSKLFQRDPKMGSNAMPVLACIDESGEFSLMPLCETVESFQLHAAPLSVAPIPGTEKMLTSCSSDSGSQLSDVHHLRLIDMGSHEEDARFRLPTGCMTSCLCLWPPAQPNPSNARSDGGNPSGFGSPIHSDVAMSDSETSSHVQPIDEATGAVPAEPSSSGIHSCLSAVKGMAAVLTCCGSFIRPPSSISSTPRHANAQLGSAGEGVLDSFYITVGTRYSRGLLDLSGHLGDLLLIQASLHISQSPFSSKHPCHKWHFEIVSRRRLPDFVGAVAGLNENLLVASVGKRLVCFGLISAGDTEKKWEKRGWILTHDAIEHLSTCPETFMVAAGDSFNSVVLYQYHDKLDEFQILYSDRCTRLNRGVHLFGGVSRVFAIDANGCFCILDPASNGHSPERALETSGQFHLRKSLSKMVVLPETEGMPGQSVLMSTLNGCLHLLTLLPDDLAPILCAMEKLLLSHPALQPLTGDEHLAPSRGGVRCFDDRCRRKGILDGDLLSELLVLPPSDQRDVFRSFAANPELMAAFSKVTSANVDSVGNNAEKLGQMALHIVKNLGTFLV